MSKRIQLVLNQKVSKLGNVGDVVDVAPGYARNFLLPQGLAYRATPGVLKQAERRREQERQRLLELKAEAEKQKQALEALTGISIEMQVGEKDAIFGSVTTQDVADAILAVGQQEVDRRHITLPEIRKLGNYTAEIKLHSDVTALITFAVVAQ
jgi:large subunit ribosomal protein L9